jgi:hypothetical protein
LTPLSPSVIRDELAGILTSEANAGGGWPYYSRKASRLEPTCWALLASRSTPTRIDAHIAFLLKCQRADGLLADRSDLPVNLSWSALTFLALGVAPPSPAIAAARRRIADAILGTGGVTVENSPGLRQNNQLRGWPWTPNTFSWVEPTSLCLLVLKQARRSDASQVIARRIVEAEALLIDRVCATGGWNYGNAVSFGSELPAQVPTTALALIALADQSRIEPVQRSLAFLDAHWRSERSGTALSLALIALRAHGRPVGDIEQALLEQWHRTRFVGNLAATAMASCALSATVQPGTPLAIPS